MRWHERATGLPALSAEVKQKLFEQNEREICQAKKRFLDEGSAEMHAARMNDAPRFRKSTSKSRTYLCPWCKFYHLTTNQRGPR